MKRYGDDLEIEFEGAGKTLKIKKAYKHRGHGDPPEDITEQFSQATKFEIYNQDETPWTLPYGTVIKTQHNPYCYWVRCGDGWYYRCVGP
jgi:hypothetical protein